MSYKFNPLTGQLDYFEEQQQTTVDSAERLKDTKVCAEVISALKMVRAVSDTDILKGNYTTYESAKCLGIALQSGSVGTSIDVLLFGKVEDPFFNFPVNAPLFLGLDGSITTVSNATDDFSVTIGYSLGAGAIFIKIEEPIYQNN